MLSALAAGAAAAMISAVVLFVERARAARKASDPAYAQYCEVAGR